MGAAQVSDSVEHISLLCSQKVAIVYFIKGDNAVLEKVMAILYLSQAHRLGFGLHLRSPRCLAARAHPE